MDVMKCQTKTSSEIMYKWENITKEFSEAVKDIALDQLIHDKLFSLFETMSAIEMMDPKMDTGMKCNRENNTSFDEAVQSGNIKLDNFTNSEIIGIIDTTLCLFVSWLEGQSLVQTVFTNLYLHNPYSIENDVLKTFCLATYKLIDIVTEFIHKAMITEEEDFQTMAYDYHLNPDISQQTIISMLRNIEEELYVELRIKKSENNNSKEVKELIALLSRIRFTRALYQCLYSILQPYKGENSGLVLECQRLLEFCTEMLLKLQNTINLGMKSTDSINEKYMGFEPLINQRFLPPTFFQYTKIKPKSEAFDYLNKLINRLKSICKEINFHSFHNTLDFFIDFSRNESCILSRSVLQVLYIKDDYVVFGNIPFIDALKNAIHTFISPPSLIKSPITSNLDVKVSITNFLSLCTQPFQDFIQLCGYNRAKQREKFVHLLEIFSTLQNEAKKTDVYLHNLSVKCKWSKPHLTHFSTWISYHILKIMIIYLLTGFELELYSLHEYYYIFWYLYEYLYGWLVSVLTRADSFLLRQHISEIKTKPKKTITNKKHDKLYKFHKEIVYNRALQNMCGGYYKALVGFQLDGRIKIPHLQFNNEQIRYEHRFAPFSCVVSPPPVSYLKFIEMTSSTQCQQIDTAQLYNAGCKHFDQACCLLKTIKSNDSNINSLLKVANANVIILKHLGKGYKKDTNVSPDFEFLFHKYLPVIKLH